VRGNRRSLRFHVARQLPPAALPAAALEWFVLCRSDTQQSAACARQDRSARRRPFALADLSGFDFDYDAFVWFDLGHRMSNGLSSLISGAAAMASFAVTLFFLKFWRQTLDNLFLLFALAFALDSAIRIVLGLTTISAEIEPMFYLARLLSFFLIIAAIVHKNRSRGDGK
jgi:hypothetical protein